MPCIESNLRAHAQAEHDEHLSEFLKEMPGIAALVASLQPGESVEFPGLTLTLRPAQLPTEPS